MQKGNGPGLHRNHKVMGEAVNLISIYSAPAMCQALQGAGDGIGNKADRNAGPQRVYVLMRNTEYTHEK